MRGTAGRSSTRPRFGTHPVQMCHEWNMATHSNGYEGDPEVRPFSRNELQSFFDQLSLAAQGLEIALDRGHQTTLSLAPSALGGSVNS